MGELVNFRDVMQSQRDFHIESGIPRRGRWSTLPRRNSRLPPPVHSLEHETDVASQLKQNHGNDSPDNCSGSHDKDGRFVETLSHNPSTACCGNNLNSEVQMVKVSLDGENNWLYTTREFPDSLLRHGNSITVRALNASKTTQPEKPTSNVLGLYPEGKADLGLGCLFGNSLPHNYFCQPKTVGFMVSNPREDLSQAPKTSCTHRRPSPSRRAHVSPRSDATKEVINYSLRDGQSETFDLTVKTYFPSPPQPGGTISHILDCLPLGSEVEIHGPTSDIIYYGNGHFSV
ncbi:hypothetical protein QR685DRAFT_576344 [Neurospora intermedia]|uniref:Flavoprotein pyridine nucleotide cytochrome reductase-like FAD-binding domain-containing protein n=1 Tax=Neurospora intermedia TaxID=5142 RepID=A0ABR3CXT1_NEUIN